MSVPLSITFRGSAGSEAVERCARLELDNLAAIHPRIESCRLALEVRSGNAYHGGAWVVHVTIVVPGRELTLDHDSGFVANQEDELVTIRAAFVAARRLLLADAKRLRDEAKAQGDEAKAQSELAKPAA